MKRRQFKVRGSIINVFSGILVIIAAATLAVAWMYMAQLADYKTDIKQIARGYGLKMETIGYLTPELKALLIRDLQEYGMENIDLTGTSFAPVGYGQDIVLAISGKLHTAELDTSSGDLLSFVFSQGTWTINIKLQSTAKY